MTPVKRTPATPGSQRPRRAETKDSAQPAPIETPPGQAPVDAPPGQAPPRDTTSYAPIDDPASQAPIDVPGNKEASRAATEDRIRADREERAKQSQRQSRAVFPERVWPD